MVCQKQSKAAETSPAKALMANGLGEHCVGCGRQLLPELGKGRGLGRAWRVASCHSGSPYLRYHWSVSATTQSSPDRETTCTERASSLPTKGSCKHALDEDFCEALSGFSSE